MSIWRRVLWAIAALRGRVCRLTIVYDDGTTWVRLFRDPRQVVAPTPGDNHDGQIVVRWDLDFGIPIVPADEAACDYIVKIYQWP